MMLQVIQVIEVLINILGMEKFRVRGKLKMQLSYNSLIFSKLVNFRGWKGGILWL